MKLLLYFLLSSALVTSTDKPAWVGSVYLGDVTDKESKVLYHVSKQFFTVPAANVCHGHSRILFFTKNWRPAAVYEVDLPEELPIALTKNSLWFGYTDKNNCIRKYQQAVGPTLPERLCISPYACFDRQAASDFYTP